MFSLPIHWVGLGLKMPASLASECFIQVIVKAIKDLIPFELNSHKLM